MSTLTLSGNFLSFRSHRKYQYQLNLSIVRSSLPGFRFAVLSFDKFRQRFSKVSFRSNEPPYRHPKIKSPGIEISLRHLPATGATDSIDNELPKWMDRLLTLRRVRAGNMNCFLHSVSVLAITPFDKLCLHQGHNNLSHNR